MGGKTHPCAACGGSARVTALEAWGCLLNTTLGAGVAGIKFLTRSARTVPCAGEGCASTSVGTEPVHSHGKHSPVCAAVGMQLWEAQEGWFSGNGMIKCKSEFVLM